MARQRLSRTKTSSSGGMTRRRGLSQGFSARRHGHSRVGGGSIRVWKGWINARGKAAGRMTAAQSAANRAGRRGRQAVGNPIRQLILDMGKIPKELQKDIKPILVLGARSVQYQAKRGSGWSSRIPKSIRYRTSFSWKNAGFRVYADNRVAPHARAYEAITGYREFRHPLFGDRGDMVTQRARPFLAPANAKAADVVMNKTVSAIDEVLKHAGYT